MKRSTRKKDLKAARPKPRDVKSGFRKLVIGGAVWQWRTTSKHAEIRTPGKLNLKWIVPTWQLQGYTSAYARQEAHRKCCHEACCGGVCEILAITPGMIRKYIDEMREAKA